MKHFIVYGIAAVVIAVIIFGAVEYTRPVEGSTDYCVADNDCVSVAAGCCDCNHGGKAIAINKEFQQSYLDDIAGECKEMACLTVISTDPSCSAAPKCENNRCVLK